ISRLVRGCFLTRKRLKKRCSVVNTEDHFERLREYTSAFSRLGGRNILFLNESGFNLHTSINYGYYPIGISPIKHQPASKRHNLFFCAIISRTGIISTKIIDGGYNSEKFGDFLDISANVGAFSNSPILIMDNASIHKTQFILNKLEDYDVEVKILPPYSSDLNPIENCFSIINSRLDRIRPRAIYKRTIKTKS
ncbi:hypothetical protein CDIK_4517, partial [Cucumispora dikerogammari]